VTAPSALSRIDDGVPLPGDVLIADIFDAQASTVGYRRDRLVESYQADVCYCGQPATNGECVPCHNDVEAEIARSCDV
jgi:hypothetical protein